MEDTESKRSSVFERHLQTILVAIITALLLWVGYTVSNSSVEIVRLQEQVSGLNDRLDSVSSLNDRVVGVETRLKILESSPVWRGN